MPEAPIPPERLARALTLLSYLLDEERGDRLPVEPLLRHLGISRTELEDDLALLNLVNHGGGTYVIYGELAGDTLEVTREPTGEELARPARLSPLMARALQLALDLLGDTLPVDGRASLESLRHKVARLVDGSIPGGLGEADNPGRGHADVTTSLNRALRERRVTRIEYYTSSREELGERRVEPYLLFQSRDSWYLEAFCLREQAQRTFRLDRIRSAEVTDEEFEPRTDVDLSSRRAGALSILPQHPRWADVRFPSARRRGLEEQGLDVTDMQDGTVRARIPYLDDRWLVREVLRFGGEAVIDSPAELRRLVAGEARVIRALYVDDPVGEPPPSG